VARSISRPARRRRTHPTGHRGGDSPVTRPSQIGDLISSRIFLSHSSKHNREAVALKQWLVDQDPPLGHSVMGARCRVFF
jgi:hypothetical protein